MVASIISHPAQNFNRIHEKLLKIVGGQVDKQHHACYNETNCGQLFRIK